MLPAPEATQVRWKKSTRSAGNGACVEVAFIAGVVASEGVSSEVVAVRDSKDSEGPVLQFGSTAWQGFVASVRQDRFGLR
jgi:hypothetical protein